MIIKEVTKDADLSMERDLIRCLAKIILKT